MFAEVDPANGQVLRRGSTDALHNNGGVGFEDDAVVDNLVDGKGDEVVVFNNGPLVNRLLEQEMQRVANRQDRVVQQDFVFLQAADDVQHDIRLELVQDDAVVVEDNVASLLGRLLNEALLERLLSLDVVVRV